MLSFDLFLLFSYSLCSWFHSLPSSIRDIGARIVEKEDEGVFEIEQDVEISNKI